MHIGVCVCKFKLFISDDKDNTIENVDLCLFLALHRHIVASLAARSSSGGVGGRFGLPPLRSSLAWLLVRSWGWWMAAPLLVGWHYYSSSRRLSANASKAVSNVYNLANKCQQPEIEVCEALGVVFPTSFGFRIMYQRSCPKPKTPFFFVEI